MVHKLQRLATGVMACLSLLFSGCLDIATTTTIHRNGTITKTMTFTGDSALIARARFPLRVDSSWNVTRGHAAENKRYATAERTFNSTEELDAALKGEPRKHVTIQTKLESSFQWFFTVYKYRETWKSFKQIDEIPLSRFVDTTLLELFYRHKVLKEPFQTPGDSLALEKSEEPYERYKARNLFEAYYKEFIKGVTTLANANLSPSSVDEKKEILFQQTTSQFKDGQLDTVKFIFAKTLKNSLALKAIDANASGLEDLGERINFESQIAAYGFTVAAVMPGIITATNSRSIEGSAASWKEFIVMGLFADVDLWVESRAINWWAVVLTGVLVIAIPIYLILASRRRRFS